MKNRGHLIIFVKQPAMGKVKTRLAADIGTVKATFWYRWQLHRLLRTFKGPLPYSKHLFVSPQSGLQYFKPYENKGWRVSQQSHGDLGQRMAKAFLTVGAGPRLLIGSDIPAISKQHIELAFKQLMSADAVFGPAEDGGYWLIGLSRFVKPPVLKNIRWSSDYALSDTLNKFGSDIRMEYLPILSDIDRGSDL